MARHLMFSGKSPISGVLDSPRFLDLGQPLPEDGKTQLISNNVRDMIEMSFWVLKFLGDLRNNMKRTT